MQGLSDSLRFLGDSTRLRILRCLNEAPLNVTELVSVLGVGQSNVSHHLSKLKKHGLVDEERQGGSKYYSLVRTPPATDGGDVEGGAKVWPLVKLAVEWQDDDDGDLSRLRDLLRSREDRQALNERLLEPGQSWFLWARALGTLLPSLDVADFGCGSGILSLEMARWARSVAAIDANAQTLAKARERAEGAGEGLARRIRFHRDDLHALSLKDRSLDLVVVSQSLHHVEHPEKVVAEAARVLRPGGHVVLVELLPHQQTWVTARLGHRWLGFEPETVRGWLKAAHFTRLELDDSVSRNTDPFRVFLFTAQVPEDT
jgi:ubiquinone/menaquinone biosynthesis C-methylase UbiE/DNA-binding transcriptional ArsR family regulator